MRPLVSILIPAYNAEKWIADTIRSAIAQTWEPKEIVVVDDGSTDQTFAVAQQFESQSVRVVTQKNQGAAAARNNAFSLSHGDYIQWLDSDDLLAPDKIESQLNSLAPGESPRILLSGSWGHFMYRTYRARFVPTSLWRDLTPAEFLLRKMGQRAYMQTAVWLVSREVTKAAGPWDTEITLDDDGEYFCRILLASDYVRFIPESKVYYRLVGPDSLSSVAQSGGKLESLWRSMQLHIHYLQSLENSERTQEACIRYLQSYMLTFYPSRPDIVEQMNDAAVSLGQGLDLPRFISKYTRIETVFGRDFAQSTQTFLRNTKWSFLRYWDKTLFRLESQKSKMQAEGV